MVNKLWFSKERCNEDAGNECVGMDKNGRFSFTDQGYCVFADLNGNFYQANLDTNENDKFDLTGYELVASSECEYILIIDGFGELNTNAKERLNITKTKEEIISSISGFYQPEPIQESRFIDSNRDNNKSEINKPKSKELSK